MKDWKLTAEDYDITSQVGEVKLQKLNENMSTKFSWSGLFTSKTIWFNVIVTVVGITTSLQGVATFDKYATVLGVVTIIGNVILKIWFNSTAIASTPTVGITY
jgi:hypothetical protein